MNKPGKDKLIKLLMQKGLGVEGATIAADHLLANDVIVPPCKVGDTVYWVTSDSKIYQTSFSLPTSWSVFGISLFLTREEAEQALTEREQT